MHQRFSHTTEANLDVCQTYVIFVRGEMKKDCMAGKCRTEMEMDPNNDKRASSIVEGRGPLTIFMIWEDVQIIAACQRYSLSVFITSTNCQDSRGAEINDWTCYQTVCISSHLHLALNFILLFSHTKKWLEIFLHRNANNNPTYLTNLTI